MRSLIPVMWQSGNLPVAAIPTSVQNMRGQHETQEDDDEDQEEMNAINTCSISSDNNRQRLRHQHFGDLFFRELDQVSCYQKHSKDEDML